MGQVDTKEVTLVDVLKYVREHIAEGNWCKGQANNHIGQRCVGQQIEDACYLLHYNPNPGYLNGYAEVTQLTINLYGTTPVRVNDNPDTTIETVKEYLDNLIAHAND
jgi:hypothetical protein